MESMEERRAAAAEISAALEVRSVHDRAVLGLADKLCRLAKEPSTTIEDFKAVLEELRVYLEAGKKANPSFQLVLACCPALEDRPPAFPLWFAVLTDA